MSFATVLSSLIPRASLLRWAPDDASRTAFDNLQQDVIQTLPDAIDSLANSLLGRPTTPTASMPLTGDYTLQVADDNIVYYPTTAVTITVPAGLLPPPNVGFVAPPAGGITFRVSGTTIDGQTMDIVVNRATGNGVFSLAPLTLTGNDYTLNQFLAPGFANLTGVATDNDSLVEQFVQPYQVPALVNSGIKNNMGTSNHTLNEGDSGNTWALKGTAATMVNLVVPPGLDLQFSAFPRNDNTGGGVLTIVAGSGVSLLSSNGLKLSVAHTGASIKCSGVQDQYYVDGFALTT